MASFAIQRARAIWYGKWLLLAFVLGLVATPAIGLGTVAVMIGGWALLCGIAARRRHMLAWMLLCLIPLALLSAAWLAQPGTPDKFGFTDPFNVRLNTAICFLAACMVTAVTGILSLHAPMPSPLDRWLKALP